MKRSVVIGAVAGVAALAGGFACGRMMFTTSIAGEPQIFPGESSQASGAKDSSLLDEESFDGDFRKWIDLYEASRKRSRLSIQHMLRRREMLAEWIKSDPEATIAYLEDENGNPNSTRFALEHVWLQTDPETFFQLLDESESRGLLVSAAAKATEIAPRFLLEYVRKQKPLDRWLAGAVPMAIGQIAKTDPGLALALTSEFEIPANTPPKTTQGTPRYFDTDFYETLAQVIAQSDPAAALEWARSHSAPGLRRSTTETALAEWALQDPEAAAAAMNELGSESGIQIENIADRIARTDPEASLLWTIEYAPPRKKREMVIGNATGLFHADQIRRIHEALDGEKWQGAYMQHQLMNWRDRPLEDGLDWVMSTPPEKQKHWMWELGKGAAGTQFDAAMEMSEEISDPDHRTSFRRGLIYSLSNSDLDRSVQLAEETGDEDFLYTVLEWGTYTHAIRSDYPPEKVAEFANRMSEFSYRSDIVSELVQRWYPNDPDATMQWIDSLGDYHRSSAIWAVSLQKAKGDPEAAIDWLATIPQDEDRNMAIPAILNNLTSRAPDKAFSLAASLTDPRSRSRETREAVDVWARRNPAEARQAILASPHLTEKEKQRLTVRIYGAQ